MDQHRETGAPGARARGGAATLTRLGAVLALLVLVVASVGCDGGRIQASSSQETSSARPSLEEFQRPQQYGGSYAGGTATGDTEAGARFARWVIEQDPNHQYITDAVVRGEQRLGVKVQPTVRKAEVQRLLTSLAEGMARTFPGKPVQVIAFYQSGDRLADAVYDPRTGKVDVLFANQ